MSWRNSLWLNLHLLWSIGIFLIRLGLAELAKRKLILAFSSAILLVGAISLLQVVKAVQASITPPTPLKLAVTVVPQMPIYRLSPDEIEEQLQYFLQVLKQQPSHKAALLNTGLLYEALGNPREAKHYFDLAAKSNQPTPYLKKDSEK